ncbi:MAG: hypothetical protein EZS28_022947, partial [Streblomastix strix]
SQAVRAGHIITKSAKSGISLLASASSFTPSLSSVWSILESDGWGGSGASMLAAGEGADILLRLQQQEKKKSNFDEKGDEGIEYELEYEDIVDKKKSNIGGIFSGEDYISSFILDYFNVYNEDGVIRGDEKVNYQIGICQGEIFIEEEDDDEDDDDDQEDQKGKEQDSIYSFKYSNF